MATLQLSVTARNHMLEALELTYNGQTLTAGTGSGGSVSGTAAAPKLRIYSGTMPGACATAASGTLLITDMPLPSDWMSAAASGAKALSGTWTTTGAAAAAGGTNAGYYRIVDNAGTVCHEQGDITITGGGGALTLDNISIATGQTVTITSKTLTAPNA